MSFGKRDRDRGDADFGAFTMRSGDNFQEFSDESLFGEDHIEDLIDKKNSF
jgi:hypothetical protein